MRDDSKHTGLTRSMIALIISPLPAPSRPSNTTQTLSPLATTQSWSLTSSACRRASSAHTFCCRAFPAAPG